ncbi:hypothetical protein [Nonlabens sp. Asnod3-A02]|uniref:hypothetical protein n=1 Tax=Nonlabens sp. Asnod3-A02 TaxID=3160579 RepID=UPI0038637898
MKKAAEFIEYYRKEIETAKRFNHLMKSSADQRAQPSAKDLFEYIMNSLKYSFAGKQKLTFMALLLFNRWNEEVNAKYQISDPYKINMTVESIFYEGNQLGV